MTDLVYTDIPVLTAIVTTRMIVITATFTGTAELPGLTANRSAFFGTIEAVFAGHTAAIHTPIIALAKHITAFFTRYTHTICQTILCVITLNLATISPKTTFIIPADFFTKARQIAALARCMANTIHAFLIFETGEIAAISAIMAPGIQTNLTGFTGNSTA